MSSVLHMPYTRLSSPLLPFFAFPLHHNSELDEKKARMAELEQQVAELTMQTEYQLRLKDLHLQEKVKELTGGTEGSGNNACGLCCEEVQAGLTGVEKCQAAELLASGRGGVML